MPMVGASGPVCGTPEPGVALAAQQPTADQVRQLAHLAYIQRSADDHIGADVQDSGHDRDHQDLDPAAAEQEQEADLNAARE